MLDFEELNGLIAILILANSRATIENDTKICSDLDNNLIDHIQSHRDQSVSLFAKNKQRINAQKSIAELGFKEWMDAEEKKDYILMRMHIRQTTNDLCRTHVGDLSMDIIMDGLEIVFRTVGNFEQQEGDLLVNGASQVIRKKLYVQGLYNGALD